MHILVPAFILEQFRKRCFHGRFTAASLFVDISGFTTITEGLMLHGSESAEVLSEALRAIFDPLVYSVYEQGGFIATFGGDSFTALFPGVNNDAQWRALSAAWAIRRRVSMTPGYVTRYGCFSFTVRIGLSNGEVEWGIAPADETQAGALQRAFYFRGDAIDTAVRAQQHARTGDIVLSRSACDALHAHILVQSLGDFYRLVALRSASLSLPQAVSLPPIDLRDAAAFFPPHLLQRSLSGEFRHVLTLFLNLEGRPAQERLDAFLGLLAGLQQEYGGYLCRIDAGDKGCSLLLFWGAPSSYEDDIERALNFVLDLQSATPLQLRAGITYGRMYAGFAGSTLREEYTCYGRWVNLAARQMIAAPWGAIWLDAATARRAPAHFDTELVDHCTFKGFAEPMPVFALRGRRQIELMPLYTSPLAGRVRELAQLSEAVQPLFEGRSAGMIVICGEEGTGKSRLLYEFERCCWSTFDRAVTWLRCQADKTVRRSLNPFRYALRAYFEQSASQSDVVNKQRFTEKLNLLIAQTDNPSIAHELDRVRSLLGALVDLHWPGSLYEQLHSRLRFEHTLEALQTFLRAEGSIRPVILALEDFHALDVDSLQFVRSLLQSMNDYPIAILVSGRPGAGQACLAEMARQVIELHPLPLDDLRLLAEGLLSRKVAPRLINLVMKRTDGNPFFAEQMLLYARDRGLLIRAGDAIDLKGSDELMPADTRALLIARLDRLPLAVREIVQAAAVLGREFEIAVLARMLAGDAALEMKVHHAERAGIWSPLHQGRYIFKSGLLRDAAYEMQLWARRRSLHQAAAEALETLYRRSLQPFYGEIAYHYQQAGVHERAIVYLAEAGEHALATGAYQEAIRLLTQALELDAQRGAALAPSTTSSRPVPERASWERLLGEAYLGLGDLQRSRRHLEQALTLMGRPVPGTSVRFAASVAGQLVMQGLHRCWPGRFVGRAAKRRRAASSMLLEATRAYERLSEVYYFAHEKRLALSAATHALNLAESLGPSPELARCYANLCLASGILSLHALAERYSRLAWETAQAVDHLPTMAWVLFAGAVYNIGVGRWLEARDALAQAMSISEQLGDHRRLDESKASLAWVFYHQGDFAQSLRLFAAVYASACERGDLQAQGWGLGGQAQTLWRMGRIAAAVTLLEQRMALLTEHADRAVPAIASYGLLAAARLRQGDLLLAQEEAERTLAMINQTSPMEITSLDGYSGVTSVYVALWEARRGRSLAEREALARAAFKACNALHHYAQIFPIGQPRAWLWHGLYQWAAGREAHAYKAWRKSLEAAERLLMPYDQGLAHYEIARHAGGSQRRRHLTRAGEIFAQLGASDDLARVQDLNG